MLGDVVAIEKAELEETKNKIIQSVASDKKRLKQYEDGILDNLESASGNILDNQAVIEALKKAQSTSELLSKRLADAETQSQSINEVCAGRSTRDGFGWFVGMERPGPPAAANAIC